MTASRTSPDAPARATAREWIGLAVLCLPTMLAAVDVNITFLALPHLAADLGASGTEQLWISDVYGFLIAGFLITAGNLGDRIGRRTVLLGGAALFLVASVLAAYATSPVMLWPHGRFSVSRAPVWSRPCWRSCARCSRIRSRWVRPWARGAPR